ncbi:MAG: PhnD/SsuA/transferrin family substrate-binding protein [Acidimicrobiia bacterium]
MTDSQQGQKGSAPARLRAGTHLASNAVTLDFHEFVAGEIGRRVGIPIDFAAETSYESCFEDLNDVCFVCSLAYVTFERRGLELAVPVAAPVLQGSRYGGKPIYFSDVIVHRDSGIDSFLALRGRSWAYNETLSQSGYGITRHHLARLGETKGFFGNLVEAGFHRDSMQMVADRAVDGSAVDSHVLALELREQPDLAEALRVVEVLGPSTIQPVAVSRRLSLELREAIRRALVTMTDDESVRLKLGRAMVERFVTIDAAAYDDIRGMIDFCEAADFLVLR